MTFWVLLKIEVSQGPQGFRVGENPKPQIPIRGLLRNISGNTQLRMVTRAGAEVKGFLTFLDVFT